jgi:predicted ArsR family transcriptional regulator
MDEVSAELPSFEVLRALADPTRHALFRELEHAPQPLTTVDLAERAGLHPNTVRAHLDHLCEVGLVHADVARTGGRGRPRHRFSVRRSQHPNRRLAHSLLELVRTAGVDHDQVAGVGRRVGRAEGPGPMVDPTVAVTAVARHEADAGFAPAVEADGPGRWRLSFTECPHRELAGQDPDVVCGLHRGTVEGLCQATGCLELESFAPTGDVAGCQAVLHEVRRA